MDTRRLLMSGLATSDWIMIWTVSGIKPWGHGTGPCSANLDRAVMYLCVTEQVSMLGT